MSRFSRVWSQLGPGILFAGAAIGVSHLVQSTRAGADYGFALVWAVILANLFKYPFFEFGSRYANATGASLLKGYRMRGIKILVVYMLLTLVTMFAVTGAVTFVTAGILGELIGWEKSPVLLSALILVFCLAVLLVGRYQWLNNTLKVIAFLLLISTVITVVVALLNFNSQISTSSSSASVFKAEGIVFLIGLMGWMPTAVDLSTWNSLWTVEQMKAQKRKIPLKETLFDFNVGYGLSVFLSFCFLILGALLIYGSGKTMPDGAVAFAGELLSLFTITLGDWIYPIIGIAALSAMFSTTLTVIDGYGRAFSETVDLIYSQKKSFPAGIKYTVAMLFIGIGAYFVIAYLGNSLSRLVDFATALSFVIAPVFAWLNYRLVFGKEMPKEAIPPPLLKYLAWAGIVFLTSFTAFFLYVRFL
ncbi:MAG: divalent metal cation transporter [Cyclobacteriaceae bacterium]|nr:divalent metal cation transporter [Cyclobacteriaceae bacterium]MCH8515220.1 divalent metal cation transporter [Cyclobacteriaceae bacterium]